VRSLLFVPADSERKLAKAQSAGADALILDLEDSVTAARKPIARGLAADYLTSARGQPGIWVRINDRGSGLAEDDLAAVIARRPAGIVLPKIEGPRDIELVAQRIGQLETAAGLPAGAIALLALVTETPAAVLRIPQLLELSCARLVALSWGAEDLSAALGAGDPRTADGRWRPTYEFARSQCLLAAHALAIEAIDSVFVDFRDLQGLKAACASSRHDGFSGRLAIHPEQVAIINESYTPSDSERAQAQRIVDAFGAGEGTVSLDGKMYDLPHLKAARRVLRSFTPQESGS
jgi:citrate lyase subunit beta / citryl-CoA lyase